MATCTPETPTRAIVLLLLGSIFIGVNECLTSTCATICLEDQREIGTALGFGGSARSVISTLSITIYTVILSNRLNATVPQQVPLALLQAGLPKDSVVAFLAAYADGSPIAFNGIHGLTPEILAIGMKAYKYALADAYRTVFLVTIAFNGVGFILTWFAPNVD